MTWLTFQRKFRPLGELILIEKSQNLLQLLQRNTDFEADHYSYLMCYFMLSELLTLRMLSCKALLNKSALLIKN
jgi:hypothetical protein